MFTYENFTRSNNQWRVPYQKVYATEVVCGPFFSWLSRKFWSLVNFIRLFYWRKEKNIFFCKRLGDLVKPFLFPIIYTYLLFYDFQDINTVTPMSGLGTLSTICTNTNEIILSVPRPSTKLLWFAHKALSASPRRPKKRPQWPRPQKNIGIAIVLSTSSLHPQRFVPSIENIDIIFSHSHLFVCELAYFDLKTLQIFEVVIPI